MTRCIVFLLTITLLLGGALRLYNPNWDLGAFPHPDERSTLQFYAPTIRLPADWQDSLDPRQSPLNPFWDVPNQTRRSYTYGHFPLYALVLIGAFLSQFAPLLESLHAPPEIIAFFSQTTTDRGYAIIGRVFVGLLDTCSIYLVFLIARRLYGNWTGLLAAALSAFAVLHIQLAHFFAVDLISTTFVLLTVYGSLLMYDRYTAGPAVLTGIALGLAVSSKYSALPAVVLPPVMAGWFIFRQSLRTTGQVTRTGKVFQLIFITGAVSFVTFALTSPFVLLDYDNFYEVVVKDQGAILASGTADAPYTRQYRGTLPYLYFIEQQLKWGLGWPLGLLALVGSFWAIIQAFRGKLQAGGWIILVWLIPYFGWTGLFLAKFMRYMSPVTPFAIIFGAGLLFELARKVSSRLAVTLAGIVLVGSAMWSLMFMNGVYGTEHTWVTASRWIYANIPEGACIAREHWEENVPVSWAEPGMSAYDHGYRQPQLPMYEEDSQQKYEFIRSTLMNCDYLVLASNRMWRTIPKLPERYPMSTRYYEALFSGELGFEPIFTIETPPRLGPFQINDQAADESFTVYDHPKPTIFKKTRQLSAEAWDGILGNTWQGATPWYIGEPTLLMRLRGATHSPEISPAEAGAGKSLLLHTPVDQLPVIHDYEWNSLANNSTLVAVVWWWVIASLIGLLAWPLTFLLFYKLPDRGYAFSKSLGILLVSYLVWLSSSSGVLYNTDFTALIALLIVGGVNLGAAVKHRHALRHFLKSQRLTIVLAEAVFGAVYLFFVYLRLLNPDLWHPWLGGEKMLEIGFLNAIVKSATMPPYDPFFANGIINYYYYGLFLVGVLIKLTGIQPAIAFNLAVPMLAGLTAVQLFSLAGNLAQTDLSFKRLTPRRRTSHSTSEAQPAQGFKVSRYISTGLLGVLFVAFIGNLEGAAQLIRDLGQVNSASSAFTRVIPGLETFGLAISGLVHLTTTRSPLPPYSYWDPSRVIPQTINEFPYFSFLFADLHPHMINLSFTGLFLGLAYHWLRPAADGQQLPVGEAKGDDSSPAPNYVSHFTLELQSSLTPLASVFLRWLALPFVLGAIVVINTWDLPTYLGLILAVFLLNRYRRLGGKLTIVQGVHLVISGVAFISTLLVAIYFLYFPFFANYQPPAETGLGLVHAPTALAQHLKIWIFFIFIILSWILVSLLHPASRNSLLRSISLGLRRWNVWPHLSQIYEGVVRHRAEWSAFAVWGSGFALAVALFLWVAGYPVPAYLLPLMLLALLLLFRPEAQAETVYLSLLAFTGLLILLGVEVFYLRDFLDGGEAYRMNTLFKFYTQVWLLFGLMTAVALPQLWRWAQGCWPLPVQLFWRGATLLLLLAVLVYPLFGTRTRINDRFPGEANRPAGGTLDGLAYMSMGIFEFEFPPGSNNFKRVALKYDYEAIRWLQENVKGTPIIAEGKVEYYRAGGMRVAAYTGLPMPLGGLHQNEQRYAWQVDDRALLVDEFWQTTDTSRTLQLLDQLNITYIYLGQIERAIYGDHIQNKFEQLRAEDALELVFENEETKIYKGVRESALPGK